MYNNQSSTDHQPFLALHPGKRRCCMATSSHNQTIGCLSRQKCVWPLCHYSLKMSVNWVSSILGLPLWKIKGLTLLSSIIELASAFLGKMLAKTSSPCPKNDCQRRVNNFRPCVLEYKTGMRLLLSIIELSAAFLGKNAVDNLVTMPYKWASPQSLRLLAMYLGKCNGCGATLGHNRTIGRLSR